MPIVVPTNTASVSRTPQHSQQGYICALLQQRWSERHGLRFFDPPPLGWSKRGFCWLKVGRPLIKIAFVPPNEDNSKIAGSPGGLVLENTLFNLTGDYPDPMPREKLSCFSPHRFSLPNSSTTLLVGGQCTLWLMPVRQVFLA